MAEFTEEFLDTQGYRSRVLRAGAGSARCILLLHGGGPGADATANWRPTLAGLGDEMEVIAPDLLGFGATDHPDPPLVGPAAWLDARVEQLVAILDAVGHERATLVGNSLGGALALRFAVARPERLDRLVLMGSGGAPFKPGQALLELLGFYSDPTPRRLRSVLDSFVYDLDGFGDLDALVEARLRVAMRPEARRSYEAMFASPDGQPVRELALPEEAVRAIEHETLIVHGREDDIIPLDASLWLLERIPNADLHVFSRCGHWAMLEQPERFNRLVRDLVLEEREVASR